MFAATGADEAPPGHPRLQAASRFPRQASERA